VDEEAAPLAEAAISESSRQQTAKRAGQILVGKNVGFHIPTGKQKQNLLVAFAKRNLVIYGKAFDALKLLNPVDLDSLPEIEEHLDDIILYEIKSTNRDIAADFSGYFFALTTAELLVAQNLKKRYKFVFVNVTTENFIELALTEVFAKAKGIYPTWSISF
jgi:hypothetical protein